MQQIQQIKYGKKPLGLVLIGFIFAGRAAIAGIMMFIYGLRFLDMQTKDLLPYLFMLLLTGFFTFFHFKIVQGLFGLIEKMRKRAVILESIILVCYGINWWFFTERTSLGQIIAIVITMLIIWYLSRDKTRAWFTPTR